MLSWMLVRCVCSGEGARELEYVRCRCIDSRLRTMFAHFSFVACLPARSSESVKMENSVEKEEKRMPTWFGMSARPLHRVVVVSISIYE